MKNKKLLINQKWILQPEYIEPFFVGLFEGDGCIYMTKRPSLKSEVGYRSIPRLVIGLKDLPENVLMLKHINSYFGGRIHVIKQERLRKITWAATNLKTISLCLQVFERYPFLTTNKFLQLEHLKQCSVLNDWDYHLKTRDSRFSKQEEMVQQKKITFITPTYFGPWLSGFIEAEGSFAFFHKLVLVIGLNHDYYLIRAIRNYFKSDHSIRITKSTKKLKYYRLEMGNRQVIQNIIAHFDKYPLLGYKAVSYDLFYKQALINRL
jgi:hypothetical protein